MAKVFALTVAGSLGLLALAIWPGLLEDLVFHSLFSCLTLPLLGGWAIYVLVIFVRDAARMPDDSSKRDHWGLWSGLVMFITMALLSFGVPQRIGFALCYTGFQDLVDEGEAQQWQREDLNMQVGPYRVDRYAKDRRGGVFLRTYVGFDGIGPDQMSYGFAFRPNRQGTPFGNAGYRRWRLFGEWYFFATSDDA